MPLRTTDDASSPLVPFVRAEIVTEAAAHVIDHRAPDIERSVRDEIERESQTPTGRIGGGYDAERRVIASSRRGARLRV